MAHRVPPHPPPTPPRNASPRDPPPHPTPPNPAPTVCRYGSDPVIESVLVKFTSGEHEAWGEACTLGAPTYSPEHAAGIFSALTEHFVDLVVGEEFESSEELHFALRWFKGNQFAKAALDTAWWGLRSVERGVPLHQLFAETSGLPVADATEIGFHPTEAFAVGADFGVRDSIEELLDLVGEAVEMGAPRIKLKCAKGWDTEMLTAIRQRFPPPIIFHIDCNGGYDLREDIEFLSSLDQYELAMIEQPLNPTTGGNSRDLLDHAELAKMLKTPICLDESLNSLRAAETAVELDSGKVFNIKPGRCGGATVALQIMALAREHDIPCWIGGMLESAVGAEFCKALASLDNCSYPGNPTPL